jgi:hypothetical protein
MRFRGRAGEELEEVLGGEHFEPPQGTAHGKLIGQWLPDKTSDNLPNENPREDGGKRPTGDDMSSKQAVAGSSPVSRSIYPLTTSFDRL